MHHDDAIKRRLATYPHAYPTGWYRVLDSHELRPGQLRTVACLGREMVLFRGKTNPSVTALDAYCPHLGAHLGDGTVEDDTLVCPFHHWRFGRDGSVTSTPRGPVSRAVRADCIHVRELHGMVLVFHNAEGRTDEPHELGDYEELDSGALVPRGWKDLGTVAMHLIEFAENSVDFQHFDVLHSRMKLPWTQWSVPKVKIRHRVRWSPGDPDPWKATFRDSAVLEVFGKERSWSAAEATIEFLGPGGVATFRFELPKLGQILMFQTLTPLSPLEQSVRFRWFASRSVPRLVVWYVVGSWMSQFAEDIGIWEKKIYRDPPKLVPGDGPVRRMRDWYRQFLPEDLTPTTVEKGRRLATATASRDSSRSNRLD